MTSGALLALVAWQLVLVESIREIQSYDVDSDALSNIELLIPLMVSEQTAASERFDRAHEPRPDDDTAFSNIPADAFTLDNEISVPERPQRPDRSVRPDRYDRPRKPARPARRPEPSPAPADAPVPRGSRKRQLDYSPRSLYLQSDSGELVVDLWRACQRASLARAPRSPRALSAHALLLLLCAALQDEPPAPAPPAPLAPAPCACCQGAAGAGAWRTRRDLMPLSGDVEMVKRYMHMPRTRRPKPWLTLPNE